MPPGSWLSAFLSDTGLFVCGRTSFVVFYVRELEVKQADGLAVCTYASYYQEQLLGADDRLLMAQALYFTTASMPKENACLSATSDPTLLLL